MRHRACLINRRTRRPNSYMIHCPPTVKNKREILMVSVKDRATFIGPCPEKDKKNTVDGFTYWFTDVMNGPFMITRPPIPILLSLLKFIGGSCKTDGTWSGHRSNNMYDVLRRAADSQMCPERIVDFTCISRPYRRETTNNHLVRCAFQEWTTIRVQWMVPLLLMISKMNRHCLDW